MTHETSILALEERSFNAWPALHTETLSGWVFRFSGGFTKRANSVNPVSPTGSFSEVQAAAEAAYARKGLPAIFRLTPLAPPDADEVLKASGYSTFDPSLVMTASLNALGKPIAVSIEASPTEAWLSGFAEANRVAPLLRPHHDAIVRVIRQPAAFATVQDDRGEPLGYGLGVYERGMVGLFDIVVAPAARGQGLGRSLTTAIMQWGQSMGATQAYLNVRSVNTVAMNLYQSLGFETAYAYHYRMPPG